MKTLEDTITTYQAAGKLMLFGEYLVLKGADCLAFPLKFGQTLTIQRSSHFYWESYAKDGLWFSVSMDDDLEIIETNNIKVAQILQQLFLVIRKERPELELQHFFKAEANFQLDWGLGSSSTLIRLLNQWSEVDPQLLLDVSFGGSGYDVACAKAKAPILYANNQIKLEVQLSKSITDKMLFVYLGNKQSSKKEVQRFEDIEVPSEDILKMNGIIEKAIKTDEIEVFEQLINNSNELIASRIEIPMLKPQLFKDYPYSIKYLGAWGGDFFLATYRDLDKAKTFFKQKGYNTMFTYKELIR